MFTVTDGLITNADAYFDSGDVARQLGLLPTAGSKSEARLATVANAGTRLRRIAGGTPPEAIAAGVWVLRGGRMRNMNVYLIADEGGITMFDAGISVMPACSRPRLLALVASSASCSATPMPITAARPKRSARRSTATRPSGPPPSRPRASATTGISTSWRLTPG